MSTSTPRSRRTAAASNPIEPAPMTTARDPDGGFTRFMPWTTTASGSTRPTALSGVSLGISNRREGSTITYSASPPSMEMPCALVVASAHVLGALMRHDMQVPHSPVGRTATSRPSAVRPPNSWPSTTPESPICTKCKSLPHIPEEVTVMSSPSPEGMSLSTS